MPTLNEIIESARIAIAQAATVPADLMAERPSTSYDQAMVAQRSAAMRIMYSPHALEFTDERLFPESKHRSRRVLKKLMKRHGSEYRLRPTIWQTPAGIVAHPNFKAKLEAAIAAQ